MARSDEEQPSRGFKVDDRRRFAGNDSSAAERAAEDAAAEEASEKHAPERPPEAPAATRAGDEDVAGVLGEMTFSTFVMGLTTQALMHLGEIPDPVHQQVGQDLPAAKQMIDLLGILSEKTKGNLDEAEKQLLGNMLYDLRIRYVEVSRNR